MALDPTGRPWRSPNMTLGEAQLAGVVRLRLSCIADYADGGCAVRVKRCKHFAQISIETAIARWGYDIRMVDVPVKCSKCGRNRVSVTGHIPYVNPANGKRPFEPGG